MKKIAAQPNTGYFSPRSNGDHGKTLITAISIRAKHKQVLKKYSKEQGVSFSYMIETLAMEALRARLSKGKSKSS